ncbi:unnamed protein product [Cylindrotheca closterium]|uniref:Uncharacterized protein n=1 Tax=Cylindrotheca closterium TaxID=2856 RepID=A0AAD2CJB3_9STRA|nr:unnamed protein product [Cylindrotheca closterium]
MPTTRSGMNSTPTPPAGAANQPASPANTTVGSITVQPGNTFASLEFAVTVLFQASLDSPLRRALCRDGCVNFMDLLGYKEAELLNLKYNTPILDAKGVDTGQTQLTQLERPCCAIIWALHGYAYLRENVHRDLITPINCMNIDTKAFQNYRSLWDTLGESISMACHGGSKSDAAKVVHDSAPRKEVVQNQMMGLPEDLAITIFLGDHGRDHCCNHSDFIWPLCTKSCRTMMQVVAMDVCLWTTPRRISYNHDLTSFGNSRLP